MQEEVVDGSCFGGSRSRDFDDVRRSWCRCHRAGRRRRRRPYRLLLSEIRFDMVVVAAADYDDIVVLDDIDPTADNNTPDFHSPSTTKKVAFAKTSKTSRTRTGSYPASPPSSSSSSSSDGYFPASNCSSL